MNSCASEQVNNNEDNLFITSGEEEPLAVLGGVEDWLRESPVSSLYNVFVMMECGAKIPIKDYLHDWLGISKSRPEDDNRKHLDLPAHLL